MIFKPETKKFIDSRKIVDTRRKKIREDALKYLKMQRGLLDLEPKN